MNNLKPLVNDKKLYEAFLSEVESRIALAQKTLEQCSTIEEVYRAQGGIAELRKLLYLREKVNNG